MGVNHYQWKTSIVWVKWHSHVDHVGVLWLYKVLNLGGSRFLLAVSTPLCKWILITLLVHTSITVEEWKYKIIFLYIHVPCCLSRSSCSILHFNYLRPVLSFSLATSIHWFAQSYCEATNAMTTMLILLLLYQFWRTEICICHKSHPSRDEMRDLQIVPQGHSCFCFFLYSGTPHARHSCSFWTVR